ncbi:MAG: hypothetical protein GY859_31010 [Desulfobacterales bacterium]|nr:hypothetical protein [Desulfobacterales bacterium]
MNYCKRTKKTILALAAAAALSMWLSGAALAHKVTIFAWVEGDAVHTVSKFSGGKKVKAGRVVVTDAQGTRLLEGVTDNLGEFSFKAPKKADLRIELIAGMGHKNHWTIPAEDFEADSPAAGAGKPGAPANQAARGKTPDPDQAGGPRGEDISPEIQAAVEKALDKKLKPVIKMLAESRDRKPSFQDILGGIGYIFGLVGVAAWIQARGRKGRERAGEPS